MKFSLTVKISLLLAANLLLLVGLGTGWFLLRSSTGWQTLATGPLSDRVQVMADTVVRELWSEPPPGRDTLLAREARAYGVEFLWVRNDGTVLAGPAQSLPAPVQTELKHQGPARLRRPAAGPAEEADGPPPPPDRRELRRGGTGRFLVQAPDGSYWFGLRWQPTPEVERSEAPPPTTMLIRVRSAWALGRLLGLQAWALVPALAMGCSILFWLPFARAVSRRLHHLTVATGQIAEGRFDHRAGVTGQDEIGRLGESIDAMASRLDTLVNGQKIFLGDVAHELCSPIARLQVGVEILQQQLGTRQEPLLDDVREEVQQISALVNELLAFTEAGLQARRAERENLALPVLLAKVCAQENSPARVHCSCPEGLTVQADPRLLARAVGNLLRNALRYAGESAAITVAARREKDSTVITVADDGPGVPPAALARLGEPFYRPEAARTRENGGVGLGLSIVQSSIAACGGQVVFRNRLPQGFEAEIRLAAGLPEITPA